MPLVMGDAMPHVIPLPNHVGTTDKRKIVPTSPLSARFPEKICRKIEGDDPTCPPAGGPRAKRGIPPLLARLGRARPRAK
jgi:hypothetical protein